MSDLISGSQELLLLCLRSGDERSKAARLEGLSPAAWASLVQEASVHGVVPLLAWRLRTLLDDLDVPQNVRQELRQGSLRSAGRNLFLYHELGIALRALRKADVPTIALKGAHLAELVYADIALRPMGDVDLMIKVEDLARAGEVLARQGYYSHRRFQPEREVARHLHLPPLYKPGGITIELHWSIALPNTRLQVETDELWARAWHVDIAGVPTLALSPEHLLVHLCLHFCQHEFKLGLRHLCDLVETLDLYAERLDWEQVVDQAARWKAGKCVFLALHLALALLGAPVPAVALSALRPADFTPQIEQLAMERILNVGQPPTLHPDLVGLLGERPLRNRLRPFLSSLFPPLEYISQRYSVPLDSKRVYLYYLVRLKDLLQQYGWQLARMIRRDQASREAIRQENLLTDWWMST